MSRFIIKHLRWKKEWGKVGTPYDYGCSDNTNYTRITDPNLPRVGEFFTDENGVTYLHTYKNGTHAYVKAKVDGAKNIFSERSYDADFIQERKSLEEVKVFDKNVKCISSLENEYIAILASDSDSEGDFVEFQNFRDFFCKADAPVSLGGTDNYLFRLDSTAKAIYLCRTVRGLTLLVHYTNNTLGFFCYDIVLDDESQFDPENVGFYPIDISESNIPSSAEYIVQLSEDGQFMFFDDEISEINLNPNEVGDITSAAGSPISVVAKPLVKSLSKAWQKEYTHRLDSVDGSARHFVIPVHSGNSTQALVYDSDESNKWQIKDTSKNYGENAVCSVIGLSKFIIRDDNKTTAYKLGLNNVPKVYSQNLPDADILIDDSDYQYSRISGKLFEERCSVSALREGTNGYHVDNITVADEKANASSLDRDVFKNAVFGASISNITYLGLGYVTVVGSNDTDTTTVVTNTGFVSSIENINVEEINAEKITVRNNEDEFSDGVTIDHNSMELKNGNNEITIDVGKDDQTSNDKVTLKASNKNASSGSVITETNNENKAVNTTIVNQGDKPKVEETVAVNNSGASITENKEVSNTKESEIIKNNNYNRTVTSKNNSNTSKISEVATSGDGSTDEGKVEREIAKRSNADIGSDNESEKGSFVRETVSSNNVVLERAVNLGNGTNGNIHEKIEMKKDSSEFNYERSLEVENKITEAVTAAEISKTSTVDTDTVITEEADGNSYSHSAKNVNKQVADKIDSNTVERDTEYSSTQYVKETATNSESKVDVKNGGAQIEVKAAGTNGANNDINMHLPDTNTREVVDRAGAIETAAGTTVSSDTYGNYKIYMRKSNKTYETSLTSLENYIRRVRNNRSISDENGILADDPNFGWISCICSNLKNKFIKLIEVTLPPTSSSSAGSTINFDLCSGSTDDDAYSANVTMEIRYSSSAVTKLHLIAGSVRGRGKSDLFDSLLQSTNPNANYVFFPYARRDSSTGNVSYGLAIHVGQAYNSLKWTLLGIKFNHIAENYYTSLKILNKLDRISSANPSYKYFQPSDLFTEFKFTENEAIVQALSSDVNSDFFSDGSKAFGSSGIGADEANGKEKPIWIDGNGIPKPLSEVYTASQVDADFVRIDKFVTKGYLLYGTGAKTYEGLPPKTNNSTYYLKCKGSNISWEEVTFPEASDVVRKDFAGSDNFHIIQANNSTWKKVDHPAGNGKYYLSVSDKHTFNWDDASNVLKRQTRTENNQTKDVAATKDDCILVKKDGDTSTKRISTETSDTTRRYLAFKSNSGYSWETAEEITGSLSSHVKIHNSLNGATSELSDNLMGQGGQVTLTSDFFLDKDRKEKATLWNNKIAFFKFRTDQMTVSGHDRFAEVNFYCGFMIFYFRQADEEHFPCNTEGDGIKVLKPESFTALYNFLKNKDSSVIKDFSYQKPGSAEVKTGLDDFEIDDFLEKVNNYHSTSNVLFYADIYHFKKFFLQAIMKDGATHGVALVTIFMMVNRRFYDNMPIYPWTTFETKDDNDGCKFVIDRDADATVHWSAKIVGAQSSFGENDLGYVPSGKLASWFRDPWCSKGISGRYKGSSGSSNSTFKFSFKMSVEEQGSGYRGKYKLYINVDGHSIIKYF